MSSNDTLLTLKCSLISEDSEAGSSYANSPLQQRHNTSNNKQQGFIPGVTVH